MRFSSIATVAAAVAPIAVSASGKLGFALGVRHAGKLGLHTIRDPRF